MNLRIDTNEKSLTIRKDNKETELDLYSREAFEALSSLWLKVGWVLKYSYTFTWLGRPIIQLPEDILRLQEVIYRLKPDVILETGIAHGGSLIFYASLCETMKKGRVIGIDIEIKPDSRRALEEHELSNHITLIEGNSVDPAIVEKAKSLLNPGETVLVILDSNHTKAHVLAELEAYSPLVTPGSFVVVTDGIMHDLAGLANGEDDWVWNNPKAAAEEFLGQHHDFTLAEPVFEFSESAVSKPITYWPGAWLLKLSK